MDSDGIYMTKRCYVQATKVQQRIKIKTRFGEKETEPGDWVISTTEGAQGVMNNADFHAHYEFCRETED